MVLLWSIVAIVVVLALFAVRRVVRLLVFVFAAAAAGLLLLHIKTAPGEAVAGLAVLAGGLTVSRFARRIVIGFVS